MKKYIVKDTTITNEKDCFEGKEYVLLDKYPLDLTKHSRIEKIEVLELETSGEPSFNFFEGEEEDTLIVTTTDGKQYFFEENIVRNRKDEMTMLSAPDKEEEEIIDNILDRLSNKDFDEIYVRHAFTYELSASYHCSTFKNGLPVTEIRANLSPGTKQVMFIYEYDPEAFSLINKWPLAR